MLKRCIMIFPEFENPKIIDNIRDKYDPLANHVRPHITLVFPFESDIKTDDLRTHISSVLSEIRPFEIILNKITPTNSFEVESVSSRKYNYLLLFIKFIFA
ncbi:2'-5' RNA ligase family protein [Clostridium folliculivorans]|uniref:2'-5' RNA ligase family protein n=1 Tax=Clostridium folliculivorans TaxID=2886038 RepID=UPI0021C39325|nr:2'-5' RNA ligase family protein [Clostridium folliculivorans]GKU28576.1 hypothetical protein CFB3_06820 [Clostridium folliculivorans]